jgi:hypothetical protein
MNRALWKLLRLRIRAAIRVRLRKLKTLRGLVHLLTVVLVVGGVSASGFANGNALPVIRDLQRVATPSFDEQVLVALLLAGCILTLAVSSAPPVYFSPAETQLLFAGPFTRRDLLLYKFLAYTGGAAMTALVVGFLAPTSSGFLIAFVSVLLTLLFIQLFTTGIAFLDLAVTFRGVRFMRMLLLAALAMTLLSLISLRGDGSWAQLFPDAGRQCADLVTAPFRIFAHLFFISDLYPTFLYWSAIAVLTNVLLITFVVYLSPDYREVVSAASEHLYARWHRANRSGVWTDVRSSRWKLPHLFGRSAFGMLVWRQLTAALRSYRGSLFKLVLLFLVVGPIMTIPSSPVMPLALKLGLVASLVLFLLPKTITFDFRSDWEHMDTLRSLPLSSWVISSAQLVTPVVLTTILEAIGLASSLAFVPRSMIPHLMLVMVCLLPFNAMLFAVDNLMFLLFPAPLTPVGRLDFEFFGRALLEFVVRSCVLCAAGGLALVLGSWASSWIGSMRLAFFFASLLVFTMTTLMLLPCLSWAYRRFDAG